ncbi:MAG TPA: transcription termination/antitermination protein NusA, partial [Solirubrobacteraceae bacterium]
DIRSESEFAAEEAENGYEEEEIQGRCAAILSNGRRCPNASLSGSRYCGLETHQALANIEGDQIADLTPTGEEPQEPEPVDGPVEAPIAAEASESEPATLGDPVEIAGPSEAFAAQEAVEEQTP